jgi:hypothetical protein
VPGADNRYLALCVLMTSEQKVNIMAKETGSRFLAVDETATSTLIDSMKNENTKRKTGYDVGIFKQLLSIVRELQNPEDIEVSELNMLLARFYLSVRTKLNQEYEPDSLKSIQSSISRYLNEKRNINILKDKEFQHSRDVIDAKRKELKGKGLRNKKNRADAFTSEENILYIDRSCWEQVNFIAFFFTRHIFTIMSLLLNTFTMITECKNILLSVLLLAHIYYSFSYMLCSPM